MGFGGEKDMTTAEGVELALALGTFLMALLTGWMAYHTKRLAQASVAVLAEGHLPDLDMQIKDQEEMLRNTQLRIDDVRSGRVQAQDHCGSVWQLQNEVFKNTTFPESRLMRDVAVEFKNALSEGRLDDAQKVIPKLSPALEELKCRRGKLKKQVGAALL